MKTIEIESNLDPDKKLMVILFWTNRKAARTEGCAQFVLDKITTPEKVYTGEGTKILKLTEEILEDLENNIKSGKPLRFEIKMGEELIDLSLDNNVITVSTQKSEEIEEEIVDKLQTELKKKYPSICESFKPRVTPQA